MRDLKRFSPVQLLALAAALGLGALCTAGCHDDSTDPPPAPTSTDPRSLGKGSGPDTGPPGSSSTPGKAGSSSNPAQNANSSGSTVHN